MTVNQPKPDNHTIGIRPGQEVRNGFVYGCHCELDLGDHPDGCVVDYGAYGDCTHAVLPSGRLRKSKWTCPHWKKVGHAPSNPESDKLYTEADLAEAVKRSRNEALEDAAKACDGKAKECRSMANDPSCLNDLRWDSAEDAKQAMIYFAQRHEYDAAAIRALRSE